MITLKTSNEIRTMRKAGRIVGETLEELTAMIRPGVATNELDKTAEDFIRRRGAIPAFLHYRGYPKTLCVSINEVVIHGIPDDRVIKTGDLVSIDVGVKLSDYFGDAAVTIPVPPITKEKEDLLAAGRKALANAMTAAVEGNRLYDISHAIESTTRDAGFSVVRDFVGHGIGKTLHEDPQVPNYGKPGRGPRLKAGMTIAIEPMINGGGWEVEILADGWTVVTRDRKPSAHFEHTIAITDGAAQILTLS